MPCFVVVLSIDIACLYSGPADRGLLSVDLRVRVASKIPFCRKELVLDDFGPFSCSRQSVSSRYPLDSPEFSFSYLER